MCARPIGSATRSCRCRRSAPSATIFPHAHLAVLAKPWVADLYARETAIDSRDPVYRRTRREFAARLRAERFDAAILLQNAFDAALVAWMAGIPVRIGYNRDGRGPAPDPRDSRARARRDSAARAFLLPRIAAPRRDSWSAFRAATRSGSMASRRRAARGWRTWRGWASRVPPIGISPGRGVWIAKRWPAERFAEVARAFAPVLLFGSAAERELVRVDRRRNARRPQSRRPDHACASSSTSRRSAACS